MIPALIMAGGKGSRMGSSTEKPMIAFLGKPLLDWVVDAVFNSKKISKFCVITSVNTPKTEEHCKNMDWKVLRTDAKGYHNDLKQAVSQLGWRGPILTMPSDVPAVTGAILDGVVCEFEASNKDFLAVFVPIEKRQELGLSTSSTDEYKGKMYAVSGVNIINGAKVLSQRKIDTTAIISENTRMVLNVNTVKDFEVAESIMRQMSLE